MIGSLVPQSDEGVLTVQIVPGNTTRNMIVHGRKFDAVLNATTHEDATFAETREIQGAWLETTAHEAGDYIELTLRGDLGEGEVEVGKFGETIYIPPSGKIEQIVSEGTVSIPIGFKLRISYVAADGGATRIVYVYYRMRK